MAYVEPLDLWNILINNFAGSVDIFIGIAVITIFGLAAYFRMTTFTTLILGALFFITFSPFIGNIYMILIFIISALAIFYVIRRMVQ